MGVGELEEGEAAAASAEVAWERGDGGKTAKENIRPSTVSSSLPHPRRSWGKGHNHKTTRSPKVFSARLSFRSLFSAESGEARKGPGKWCEEKGYRKMMVPELTHDDKFLNFTRGRRCPEDMCAVCAEDLLRGGGPKEEERWFHECHSATGEKREGRAISYHAPFSHTESKRGSFLFPPPYQK